MANCNYKVILKDIQNKYKFKIFCTGSGADLNNYYTKNETDTLLSGKVGFTDYATNSTGGVVKVGGYGSTLNSAGQLHVLTQDYTTYQTQENGYMIGKGTLENVINGKNLETANNKVTSLSSSSTDTQYPSAKAVYDSQVEQNTQISDLKEENDYLQSIINQMPKVTGEGTNITLDNTLEAKLDIQLKGNTSQYTTTGKNIFDKSNPIIINGYIRDNQPTVVVNSNNSNRIVAVQCKANTTYTVQKTGGNRFSLITYNSLISENGEYVVTNFVRGTTDGSPEPASQTISTGNDTYLYVHLFDNVNNVNLQKILATIQIEEGSSATSYEEYTGGIASPNPDYPQGIEVVTGLNEVIVEGKNLLPTQVDKWEQGGISSSTGSVITSQARLRTKDYYPIKNDTDYYVSVQNTNYCYLNILLYDNNKEYLKDYHSIAYGFNGATSKKINISSTDVPNVSYMKVVLKNSDDVSTITPSEIEIAKPMIEKGSTATTYEAYQGQNYPINLGSLEMCKIGDYQDYFYKDNGNWYKYGMIGKVVLNGSENWQGGSSSSGNVDYTYFYTEDYDNSILPNSLNSYCNKLASLVGTPMIASTNVNTDTICVGTNSTTRIRLMLLTSRLTAQSTTAFKNWLNTNNTTVYYVLATPTTTQITDTTLISQLNALEKALAYQNQTNIFQTNADKPFIIDASTIYDLSNLVTRVAVLETE